MWMASHLLPAGSLGLSDLVKAAQTGDAARCAALAQRSTFLLQAAWGCPHWSLPCRPVMLPGVHELTGSLPDLLRLGMAAVKSNDGALIPHQGCQRCGLAC